MNKMQLNKILAIIKYYYTTDRRIRNIKQMCEKYGISRTLFYYWKKKHEQMRFYTENETRGRKTIINKNVMTLIDTLLKSNSDYTLSEVTDICNKKGHKISRTTVYKIVYKLLKFRHKIKKLYILPAKKEKIDKAAILNRQRELKEAGIDNVISIDESALYAEMYSKRGWVKKGQVLKLRKTRCYHKRMTFTMAIASNRVVAINITEGSMNTMKFHDFLNHEVIPKLKANEKHILMDNVSFHRSKKVKYLLERNNINSIFTVPYTPDLNPIESSFSVIKHKVRKKFPKTATDVKNEIIKAKNQIKPQQLRNMYKRSFGLNKNLWCKV